MTNFIDSLVHKAVGASLLTRPEPSLSPGFELPFYSVVSKREKAQGDTLQDFPAISYEGFNTPKFTSEEIPAETVVESHALPEDRLQGQDEKISKSVVGISASVVISPEANRKSSNLRDAENTGSVKSTLYIDTSKRHSETLTPSSESLTHELDSRKQREHKHIPAEVNTEFTAFHQAIEVPQTGGKSSPVLSETNVLSRKDENRAVNVEPSVEPFQQAFLKDSMMKASHSLPSSPGVHSDAKTTETQQPKEVRVNIGRVEIRASQESVHRAKPFVRGFNDYLLARLYLDRHYF